jgi:hypothetical protein
MYLKHIKELTVETLKFTLNVDHTFCTQLFLGALVLYSMFKLFVSRMSTEFQDGLLTVKKDALIVKDHINAVKDHINTIAERWEQNELRDAFVNTLKNFR